jgi:hypothetical protein
MALRKINYLKVIREIIVYILICFFTTPKIFMPLR